MTVRLHIERLVVHGPPLSRGARRELAEAVERELASRLQSRPGDWPAGGASVRRVRAAPLPARASRSLPALGEQIAGSIHDGVVEAVNR